MILSLYTLFQVALKASAAQWDKKALLLYSKYNKYNEIARKERADQEEGGTIV